jgi:hypothetical protein
MTPNAKTSATQGHTRTETTFKAPEHIVKSLGFAPLELLAPRNLSELQLSLTRALGLHQAAQAKASTEQLQLLSEMSEYEIEESQHLIVLQTYHANIVAKL